MEPEHKLDLILGLLSLFLSEERIAPALFCMRPTVTENEWFFGLEHGVCIPYEVI